MTLGEEMLVQVLIAGNQKLKSIAGYFRQIVTDFETKVIDILGTVCKRLDNCDPTKPRINPWD